MKKILTLTLGLLLAACSSGIEGTYKDRLGLTEYEFNSDGTVYRRTMGLETESRYEVEDGKVRIFSKDDPNGPRLVFTLEDDGSLSGPLGLRYTKQKD